VRKGEGISNSQQPISNDKGLPLRHASRDTSPKQGRSTLDLKGGRDKKRVATDGHREGRKEEGEEGGR
jgi:hypothetical protein